MADAEKISRASEVMRKLWLSAKWLWGAVVVIASLVIVSVVWTQRFPELDLPDPNPIESAPKGREPRYVLSKDGVRWNSPRQFYRARDVEPPDKNWVEERKDRNVELKFPPLEVVDMVSPDGETLAVPVSEVREVLGYGARFETRAEESKRIRYNIMKRGPLSWSAILARLGLSALIAALAGVVFKAPVAWLEWLFGAKSKNPERPATDSPSKGWAGKLSSGFLL